jgi:hypothetical protein
VTRSLGIGLVGACIAALVWTLFSLNSLVRRLHDEYPNEWRDLGCPHGPFWVPDAAKHGILVRPRSSLAQWRVALWMVRAPGWVAEDAVSMRMLVKMRVGVLLAIVPYTAVLMLMICEG